MQPQNVLFFPIFTQAIQELTFHIYNEESLMFPMFYELNILNWSFQSLFQNKIWFCVFVGFSVAKKSYV